MFSSPIFLQGLGMGASLIMPIGAQNAHVIRTGVAGRHVALTVATCIVIDAALIALGMSGFGALIEHSPMLLKAARWGGAAFLLWYGLRCLKSCWRGTAAPNGENGADGAAGAATPSAGRALGIVLAMSQLNPHVYLDTVVLLGSLANQHGPDARWVFAAGAVAASVLWFTALGYGARLLARVLADPKAWRVVDVVIAVVMAVLAVRLIAGSGVWG